MNKLIFKIPATVTTMVLTLALATNAMATTPSMTDSNTSTSTNTQSSSATGTGTSTSTGTWVSDGTGTSTSTATSLTSSSGTDTSTGTDTDGSRSLASKEQKDAELLGLRCKDSSVPEKKTVHDKDRYVCEKKEGFLFNMMYRTADYKECNKKADTSDQIPPELASWFKSKNDKASYSQKVKQRAEYCRTLHPDLTSANAVEQDKGVSSVPKEEKEERYKTYVSVLVKGYSECVDKAKISDKVGFQTTPWKEEKKEIEEYCRELFPTTHKVRWKQVADPVKNPNGKGVVPDSETPPEYKNVKKRGKGASTSSATDSSTSMSVEDSSTTTATANGADTAAPATGTEDGKMKDGKLPAGTDDPAVKSAFDAMPVTNGTWILEWQDGRPDPVCGSWHGCSCGNENFCGVYYQPGDVIEYAPFGCDQQKWHIKCEAEEVEDDGKDHGTVTRTGTSTGTDTDTDTDTDSSSGTSTSTSTGTGSSSGTSTSTGTSTALATISSTTISTSSNTSTNTNTSSSTSTSTGSVIRMQ